MLNNYHPIYSDDQVRLYCADAREISTFIEAESVDLVITSPPYNVGIAYPNCNDRLSADQYKSFASDWLSECYKVMRDGARICVNVADTGRSPFYPTHAWYLSLMEEMFTLRGDIIWYKHNSTQQSSWGSWRSSSDPHLRAVYEHIIVAHKGSSKLLLPEGAIPNKMDRDEFLRNIVDLWGFAPATAATHPAAFPADIPLRCIRLFGHSHATVLDPFMGHGTTCSVAIAEGCTAIGVDNAIEYVNTAADILSQTEFGMKRW
jgi:DNA modification methylase